MTARARNGEIEWGDRTLHRRRGPIRTGLLVIAALIVAVLLVQLWRTVSGDDAYAVAMVALAEASLAIGNQPDAGLAVRIQNGDTSIADIAAHGPWRALREAVLETVSLAAWLGAKIGFGIVLAWSRWRNRGGQSRRPYPVEPVMAAQLARRIDPRRIRALRLIAGARASYRIAGVPLPGFSETRHTLVSGIAGTGKSVLISDPVRQITESKVGSP